MKRAMVHVLFVSLLAAAPLQAQQPEPDASPAATARAIPMPALFREKEVTVGAGQWALPGTLTLPAKEDPCCAVVLVHGWGPHDRDESTGPNRPFRDIAWGLASRGIAVLRYEKRTKEHRRMIEWERLTVDEETVDDALAAVKLLRETPRIDPKKIYLLGHCLGGMLAPRIAARDKKIAGIIIFAGASRPFEDVLLSRVEYLLSLRGDAPSPADKAALENLRAQAARVKNGSLSDATPSADLPQGLPASYWLSLRGYDPPGEARQLNRPILVLQGGRDYQVTAADFEGWKKALDGRKGAQFEWYPACNHLFVSGEGMSTPEEYLQRRKTVEGPVLDRIAVWIRAAARGEERPHSR